MSKKILAALLACMMMSCTLTACGDKDDDDSSKKTSASDIDDEDEDEDDEDEDDTKPAKTTASKEESTTEEKTTEAEASSDFIGKWECSKVVEDGNVYEGEYQNYPLSSAFKMEISKDGTGYVFSVNKRKEFTWRKKSNTEIELIDEDNDIQPVTISGKTLIIIDEESKLEINFKKVSRFTEMEIPTIGDTGKIDSNIVGSWKTKEGGVEGIYIFSPDGYGSVSIDISSMYYFDGDDFVVGGVHFSPDMYTYDGKKFYLESNGQNFVTMERKQVGSGKFDGMWVVNSGYLYDIFDSYNNTEKYSLEMKVDGKKTLFAMLNCFTYTADGKVLKFEKGAALMNNSQVDYTISGNKMTFVASGAAQNFERITQ